MGGGFVWSTGGAWEELDGHADATRKAVGDLQVAGVGGLPVGEGQPGRTGRGRVLAGGLRAGSAGQPVQDLESAGLWQLLPAPGEGGGSTKAAWRRHQDARVPTIADRIAQTVVARRLEGKVEPVSSIRTPTATGRAGRPWTRWRRAGSAAGPRTGCSTLMSRSSSTACLGVDRPRRWRHTPTSRGSGCVSGGGCKRRCSCPTAPCSSATVAPHRGRRSRPCWRTCSGTMCSTPGWPGGFPPSGSSATPATRWCTASASARPGCWSERSPTGT
jgi:hypothetical protein